MPTKEMIRVIIMSNLWNISIIGISDIIADYSQSTPGDRLLILIRQKCESDGYMYLSDSGLDIRFSIYQSRVLVEIKDDYIWNSAIPSNYGNYWRLGNSIDILDPEYAMSRLNNCYDKPLAHVYHVAMAIP